MNNIDIPNMDGSDLSLAGERVRETETIQAVDYNPVYATHNDCACGQTRGFQNHRKITIW